MSFPQWKDPEEKVYIVYTDDLPFDMHPERKYLFVQGPRPKAKDYGIAYVPAEKEEGPYEFYDYTPRPIKKGPVMTMIRRLVYATGFRPKPGSFLYSRIIEDEEKWRTGKP